MERRPGDGMGKRRICSGEIVSGFKFSLIKPLKSTCDLWRLQLTSLNPLDPINTSEGLWTTFVSEDCFVSRMTFARRASNRWWNKFDFNGNLPSNRFEDSTLLSRVERNPTAELENWKRSLVTGTHTFESVFRQIFAKIFVLLLLPRSCQTICLMPVCDPKPGALQSSSREYIKH